MAAKKKNKARNKGNRAIDNGPKTPPEKNHDTKRLTNTKPPPILKAYPSDSFGRVTRSQKMGLSTSATEASETLVTIGTGNELSNYKAELAFPHNNLGGMNSQEHANILQIHGPFSDDPRAEDGVVNKPNSTNIQCTKSDHGPDMVSDGKDKTHRCSKHTEVVSGMQVTFYSSAKPLKAQYNGNSGLPDKINGDKIKPYESAARVKSPCEDQIHTEEVNTVQPPTNADIIEALNAMKQALKGEMSDMTNKIDQLNSKMNKVENDLHSFENKWEGQMEAVLHKVSLLEKNNQSLEKRWELHRSHQSKELSIIQTGIDSNSSAVLELKNTTKKYQDRWE